MKRYRHYNRHIKLTKRNIRAITLIVALVLVLGIAVGGTVAYVYTNSDDVINEFTPGNVTCAVQETFDGTTKEDVQIKNTGNVDAYIRAVVIINWVDANGNVCAQNHASPTIEYNDTDWTLGSDGFWYYKEAIAPEALTTNLINTAFGVAQTDGCKLQVQVIASAIQSEGSGATSAQDAWGRTPSGN